ncbi:MAG: bifunctional folylpolyglutamate synthase/dihydrofolate synthase [Elusimicrobia bacterium]|nr:bifunctional folylpolyglutamate synthase/dihydrofolate synthase [Elusimicrobiota bacterium]
MTFRRAVELLRGRQESHIQLGLARVRRHLRKLGDPQNDFPVVHVAGTNAKGSVCAMLAAVLRASGRRVGLYTSPHLSDVRERIQVDGRVVSRALLAETLSRAFRQDADRSLTYFELLTSAAFQCFREERVDIAILETGLGGRLDATNVVDRPLVTVVTLIDRDHMNFLGNSLSEIAWEKAGIFKRGAPVLTAETKPAPLTVLRREASHNRAEFRALPRKTPWNVERTHWRRSIQVLRGPGDRRIRVPLLGNSQARNVALVLEVLEALRRQGWGVSTRAEETGLAETRWPGRFEALSRRGRTLIMDGAHNVGAMRHFAATLKRSPWGRRRKLFILGFLRDKEYLPMIRMLAPFWDRVVATRPPSPRALEAGALARAAARFGKARTVSVAEDPGAAVRVWLRDGRAPTVACVCGSFYSVGSAREAFLGGAA